MRITSAIVTLLLCISAKAQIADSSWLANEILPAYYVDTGTYLPVAKFINEKGQKKSLADFKGKIIYLDIWATWCPNCMGNFPYQEQLLKRMKKIGLDTLVQFVNINIDDTKKEWRAALKKYKPIGINLYCGDTSLYEKWNIEALPAYVLLDSSGKVLGKDIAIPQEAGTIDYILYAATKGVHPVEAVWTNFLQSELWRKYSPSHPSIDKDFTRWFDMTIQSFLEFQNWRKEHMNKKAF